MKTKTRKKTDEILLDLFTNEGNIEQTRNENIFIEFYGRKHTWIERPMKQINN